jgi:hypothetical protein
MRKVVLTSHINMSGSKANVFVGKRPLATIYRAGGAWNALSMAGNPLLPRIPHAPCDAQGRPLRDARGRVVEITLGSVIKTLRETLEAKLNGSAA